MFISRDWLIFVACIRSTIRMFYVCKQLCSDKQIVLPVPLISHYLVLLIKLATAVPGIALHELKILHYLVDGCTWSFCNKMFLREGPNRNGNAQNIPYNVTCLKYNHPSYKWVIELKSIKFKFTTCRSAKWVILLGTESVRWFFIQRTGSWRGTFTFTFT